jgi:hypothetical protein
MVACDDIFRYLALNFFFCFFISFFVLVSSIIIVALGGGDYIVRSIMFIFVCYFLEMGFLLGSG